MLSLVVFVACVAVTLAINGENKQWRDYKLKFKKSYDTHLEDRVRQSIYFDNLDRIDEQNANSPVGGAVFGEGPFTDLTPEEFKATFLMKTMPRHNEDLETVVSAPVDVQALPSSYDWKTKGVVTPVKNQGQCGSCWDFSATETMESVCALANYTLTKFSEQQIVDCDKTCYGCDGGWPYRAYAYVIGAGGIESEEEYPYTAQDGSCKFSKSKVEPCKITSWEYVTTTKNETQMQNFLYANSPLSICVDASSWQNYQSGVMKPGQCGQQLDHCVQATGWSVMSGTNVWNVRNSWATSWGMQGYIYLEMGHDTCGMAQVVTVPCVTSASGSKVC